MPAAMVKCWRWLGLPLLLLITLFTACRGGGGSTPTGTPNPTSDTEGIEFPTPEPTHADRQRWGHDPMLPTGLDDPPWVFRTLPEGYRRESVTGGLSMPTQMAATPDGRMFIAEQLGAVRIVEDDRLLDEPFITIDVFTPPNVDEEGLVGIAIDPQFEQTHFVYLYYTADNPRRTVIARVRDEDNRGVGLEEIYSWEAASPCCHVGGGMKFAPDGKLIVGVGDHTSPDQAQDPSNVFGSVIRLNRDGSVPADNPFGGPVYAYGLRNPYDVAIDPATGRIFAGENGLWGQDGAVEITEGANYGWPGTGLRVPPEQVKQPLTFYNEVVGMAGMEFYSSDALSDFKGKLYYCQFHVGGAIHELTFGITGEFVQERIIAAGCETDITTGADGFLYFLNYQHGVLYRIAR